MLRYDTTSTLKQAKAALSITAQNEYVEVAPASLALIEAIKQLKKVKKEYDSYKHTRDDLKDKLDELKQAYKSKTPGIDGSDIEDLSDILENVNDEERYYKANIALAMANVEAKSLALIAQVAAAAKAASNWYTFGFSVGVAASVNGHKSKSNSNEVISNPSRLSANNIKIQTPNDTTITGSNLSANNLIDINTNNLNINSSKNTYTSESKDKSIGGTMRYTMYGGGGGSAGLNYSTSSSDTESLTNNNSHLYSAKDMNINTANDATIKGANLRADERLNLKVGNNLSLESVRDKYAYNERGYSVGVGIGFSSDKSPNSSFANPSSTKATSTNANFSRSSSNTITKQTILSSITANELNVEVGKNTHLKGSLLAAGEYDKDNTFIDNHNLNLKTNTLSYENLSNTSYAKGTNFSIGANYILEDKNNKYSKSNNNQEDKFTGLKSIDLSNHRNLSYSLSKNLATLGSGNIEITDKENSDDLTRLNRDTTKLTKDLVNTSISSNVDASIDARVFSKEGREQIKSEIKHIIDKLDDFNRFVKDKISDELTNEQKEQIGKVGLENSILQALKKEGVSDEKINLLLNDENIRRLISDYENRNNANTPKSNNDIILRGVEVIAQKDLQDYLVDGAEAINSMVKIVGEEKAATAILITQFATQGIVKTSVSMLMEEGKDTLFGGVKDKISNYISKDLFDVNDKGWQDKQKEAIYSLSDVSADFSIDLALSGPFALMKGAKNLGKANKKFDESLKENNVNSDTIANSNAELKSNEHNLNNKNSSDGVGVAGNKTGKAALDRVGKKSSEVTSDITKIDNPASNTDIKHNGNSGNDGVRGIETYKRVNKNADLIKDIIENANIQSYTHKQIIRTLEDGTQIIIRKDFGENAHNLGKPFNEKMDHYNLEIQVPFKKGYKTIENIHIIPTEKGYIWYGKDKIIKGE